jgi:predicted double-glycine peptidase
MLTPARHFRPIPPGAIRIAVPDTTQQTAYSCGASCLQAICKYYGVGPDDEWEFVRALRPDHRFGSDPEPIQRAARRFGLSYREYAPMTVADLKAELRLRHPVLIIVQAWGRERRQGRLRRRLDYRHEWGDGHWLIAIGFDRDAIYFEDPSLQAVRGYLRIAELEPRWHHAGHHAAHKDHYGLALWHPHRRRSAYTTRAERVQ